MSNNFCPHCGSPNAEKASFCAQCGKTLASQGQAARCPRCSTEIRSTSRFCPSCGFNIAQQPASPQSSAGAVPGQPAPPAPATQMLGASSSVKDLVVRWMGGKTDTYKLSKQVISVGRAPGNDVVINHPAVSSSHINISVTPSGLTITDLNSTNGTQLNGHRIQPNSPRPVQAGDVLRIGDLTGNWVSLVLEGEEGGALRTLSLGKLDLSNMTNILIGRDPDSYLPLNHPTVSFRHAMIAKQNGGLVIRDLGSTNGTFVNGNRISQAPLSSGDEIQIGPFKLVYDAQAQSLAQSLRLGHRIDAIRVGREVGKKKLILQEISMCVYPGEFIALVGGSGAGKSTLLKAMNGYEPANHGRMLLDGDPLYSKLDLYRTQMGYVPQDDIIHRVLPVNKALWYAAKLRLPDARPSEIRQRIQEALQAVDMVEHQNKPVRVLSGGQRKRVSIAVELLARPTLFYLDEPTSGLDPGLEKKMMYDLNRLADEGRTIILVTHATANIEQCDQVAFLSQGFLSYYGPPKDALSFFNVQDFSDIYLELSRDVDPAQVSKIPPEIQPYVPQQQQKGGNKARKINAGILWAEHFRRSSIFKKFVVDRQKSLSSARKDGDGMAVGRIRKTRDSFIRQTFILARRQFDLVRYDWRTLFILLLMVPMIGLLFGSVSGEFDLVGRPDSAETIEAEITADLEDQDVGAKDDYLPVFTAQTLVTMIALAATQAGTFAAAYEIVKERAIFKREKAVNLNVVAYVLSKIIVLGGFAAIQVVSLILVMAIRLDFGFEGAIFGIGATELLVTLYLAVLASIAFGLFISSIVPSTDVVLYAILVQLFIQIVLSGTMFPLEQNPLSLLTVGYWTSDSIGSSIDLPQLNKDGIVCSVVEIPSMTGGDPTNEVRCDSGEQDLFLDFDHSEAHVLYTWIGLTAHIFIWTLITIIVQARKKTD